MSENILVINTTSLFLFNFLLFSGPALACTFASQSTPTKPKPLVVFTTHNQSILIRIKI